MIELQRGCGFRKVGGLYIRGSGLSVPCDRLPYLLEYCPVCGSGIKFSRNYQMIDWFKFAGEHVDKRLTGEDAIICSCNKYCPICHPVEDEKYAIMWVGDKYYDPGSFIDEAQKQGICKRIPAVPLHVKIGETWILLAHKKAGSRMVPNEEKTNGNKTIGDPPMKEIQVPAVFYAFRPTHIEKILSKKQARNKKLIKQLRDQNIKILIATEVDEKGNVIQVEPLPDDKENLGILESIL